jgi:manganese/zinc/iron transport system ATP- binding protein
MRRNVAAPLERASPKDSSNLPLEVHDLTVAYHKRPVLYGIDLTIPKGSLVGIIGPNGAGKSS